MVASCPHEKRLPYDTKRALKALHLAGSAYSEGDCLAQCIQEIDPNYHLLKEVRFPCKNVRTDLQSFVKKTEYECFAHVAVSDADKHVVVSYRGTNDPPQLLSEGGECIFKKGVSAPTGGTAYEYFYRGVHLSYGDIVEEVKPLVQKGYNLWVVGHSLGGAFATVFTSFLGKEDWVDKEGTMLITFGSPRVGDWDFARNLEFHFPNIYRIVHQRDLVVHIPPQTTNWQRVTDIGAYIYNVLKWDLEATFINWNNPYHVGKLILYDNDMSDMDDYTQCDHENETACLKYMLLDINDHLNYFQKIVSDVCKCNQPKEGSHEKSSDKIKSVNKAREDL